MAPTVLVISGPPCSGKTRLASRLARRLGWPVLAKDAFKEALFDAWGIGDADWSRRLSEAAFARQYAAAANVLAAGGSLILDGNFRSAHRRALEALAARHAAGLVQVACRATPATLAARRAARAAGGWRHRGHADARGGPGPGEAALYGPLPIARTVAHDSGAPGDTRALLAALGLA
jgi:predicted kinase